MSAPSELQKQTVQTTAVARWAGRDQPQMQVDERVCLNRRLFGMGETKVGLRLSIASGKEESIHGSGRIRQWALERKACRISAQVYIYILPRIEVSIIEKRQT